MYRISRLTLLAFVGFTEHVGSLLLKSSPLTAAEGEIFTLICSSSTTGERDTQWYRDGTFVITTTPGSSSPSVTNSYIVNIYLSGRVSVSCDATQHNVTLRINSSVDNGPSWQCLDTQSGQRSNILTIDLAPATTVLPTTSYTPPVSTVSTTTTTASSSTASASTVPPGDTSVSISTPTVTTTRQCPACVTPPSGGYVAAGTVGGAVFGSVITVVVVALWMHIKRENKDGQSPNVYASTSAYKDVDHQYAMAPRQYINTVEGTETPHYVNTDRNT